MINYELLISRIDELCDQSGNKRNKVLIECGAGKDFVVNIRKNQKPSIEKVFAIAEYFNVSVDYLLGYTPKTDDEMQEIINFYISLSPSERELAFEVAKTVLKTKTEFDKN